MLTSKIHCFFRMYSYYNAQYLERPPQKEIYICMYSFINKYKICSQFNTQINSNNSTFMFNETSLWVLDKCFSMIHFGNTGIYLYIKYYYLMTYIKYIKRNNYNCFSGEFKNEFIMMSIVNVICWQGKLTFCINFHL